jgi:small-conductance mechanosensitive channel
MMLLSELGTNITPLLAGMGVAGLDDERRFP